MARRDEIRVSLFPFMSVLACTIGALTLLLTSISLSAVAPRDESPPAASADVVDAAGASATTKAPSTERRSLERVEALWTEVDRALEKRGHAGGVSLEALETELASRRQGRRLSDSLEEIARAERSLADEGETIEAKIAVLESRRETLPILIDPTGLSRHLDPWFVECDAKGATAYRASDGYGHFLPRDELSLGSEYGRYLRRLRAMPGALLVLLVRADGLSTAGLAEQVAETAGVRVAKLPLPGRGAIDWALLRRAEGGASP